MASKSKNVRLEQLRIFEKKLTLRLQQLDKKGISKEKAQNDPLVKSLKSKIRQTKERIAVIDKFVQRAQELAKVKAQKLDEAGKKEEKAEPSPAPAKEKISEEKQKPKKKEESAEKEPKKQPAAKEEAPVKEPKKQAAAKDETAPKKAKKPPADAGEAAPKKKATKKKEE